MSISASSVLQFVRLMQENGITVWVDGGWGVDALLGEQTRPHDDLDIAIQEKDVASLRALVDARGFRNVPRDDTSAWNFVLGNSADERVDVHVVVIDSQGNGIYGPPENGLMYPSGSLDGTGSILGYPVRCIAAGHLVRFHTGYKLRPKDYHDVSALCERFGIDYPEDYQSSKSTNH
jgi:lincosamide nucleotidyltransferase A/C/D/E